jgi:hypothetical protein
MVPVVRETAVLIAAASGLGVDVHAYAAGMLTTSVVPSKWRRRRHPACHVRMVTRRPGQCAIRSRA